MDKLYGMAPSYTCGAKHSKNDNLKSNGRVFQGKTGQRQTIGKTDQFNMTNECMAARLLIRQDVKSCKIVSVKL